MKVAVTGTSATLESLLTTGQKAILKKATRGGVNKSFLFLNTLHSDHVYIEIGGPASTSTSMPIAVDKSLSVTHSDLNEINLVASGACEIYLLVSQ